MSGYVVVDASIAVKWLVTEADSDVARALRETWRADGVQLAALPFLYNEVANALLGKVRREGLPEAEALLQVRRFATFSIDYIDFPELHHRALELAFQLRHPAAYDPSYLALAEHLGCEYWLADKEFHRPARAAGHPVRLLEEHRPESPPAP